MKRLYKLLPNDEKGQSIVVMALLLSFVILAFAAVAVDGTLIYLRRRQLQNMADSAALSGAVALSQGKTEAEAYQKAMNTITTNEGEIEWYSTDLANPNPPTTNIGTGQDLVVGIEITDSCDMRVALRWSDIGTYFAQFVGRELLEVGANAHAGCNRAGGLVPIAVKRFGDEFDTDDTAPPPDKNDPATIYCEECDTRVSLTGQGNTTAFDFLRVEGSDVITDWPGWPSDPDQKFESPSPHADLNGGTPGREYYMLGAGVDPNVSTGAAFAGLVNLDLRDLTGAIESYNGVAANANTNTLKDYAAWYIRQGYCCDIPEPGDQVAIISGLSNNFSVQPLQQTYAVSDTVAVIVYDGHVYKSPDLDLDGTPDELITYPTTTTLTTNALTYTIDLEGDNGFGSAASGMGMTVEGLDGFADWSFSPTSSPVLPYLGSKQRTLTLQVTPKITTVLTTTHVITGARMFYVRSLDNGLGGTNIRRYWPAIAVFGDGNTSLINPTVTAQPSDPYVSLAKGDTSNKIDLELRLWGLTSGNYDVTVSAPSNAALPTGISWNGTSPPWVKNSLKYNKTADISIKLDVDTTATANTTPYAIPITVSSPGLEGQTFNLYVQVKEANATTKDYVVILGYAAFQITDYPNVNSVRGRIVSELLDHPSDLTYGLRARLIPW
ncbi:MAG: hypothetical protein KDJ65_25965 [Anaerolineae bacterium]|nr:hypothetical protein [Anaerolineae bacterium]